MIAVLLLLAAPAGAVARPLDDDRKFARDGIFMLSDPESAYAVLPERAGGSLYATYDGLMRLSAAGRRVEAPPLVPTGIPHTLVPGLAVGIRLPFVEYGKPSPVSVWRLGPEGTTVAHHLISVPGRYVSVEQAVRRGDGYALLLRVGKPKTYSSTLRVAALTAEGELDTTWGDGGYRSITGQRASIGGAPDGSVLVAINRTTRCVHRKVRPTLRVQRLAPDGRPARVRTHVLGRKLRCISMHPGEMHADRRGRVAIAVGRSDGGDLLRLRRDLRRDRRFGRSGIVRLTRKPTWWRPVELAPRSGGGFGVGFTTTDGDDTPHAHVALVGAGGRLIRARRLRVMRSYPSSELSDLTFDRAGRLVAAGMLRDDNVFIREDYGRPHLAVWRLRTTRSSSARTTEDRPRSRRRGARGPR